MGSLCSVSITQKEIIKGPVRTRFSLDDAPETIEKRTEIKGDGGKFSLPLIGYKNIRSRNIPLLELLRVDNKKLLSELYEYLPQYPMRMTNLSYKVLHPKGTVLHSIEYTEHKKYSFGSLWKKESFGKTWTEVGHRTASYTYDPMLRHVLKRVLIKDIRIYDSQTILPMSVYVECTDIDGNVHTIYPANTLENSNQVYLLTMNIKETMYLDQMESRVNRIFDSMRTPKENIRIKKESGTNGTNDHETIVLDDATEEPVAKSDKKKIIEEEEDVEKENVGENVEEVDVEETVEEDNVEEAVEDETDEDETDEDEEVGQVEREDVGENNDEEKSSVSVSQLLDIFETRTT